MTTATLSEAEPLHFEPVKIGPTWQRDENHPSGWLLPERTLGWHIVAWQEGRFQHDDGKQWRYTPEQLRLLLWLYAVDDDLRFEYNDAVLQRLKGWGKDPFGATVCGVELLGPCRPDRTGRTVRDPWGNEHPAGVDNPAAWVQIAAASREQTKNTMTLMPGLFTKACREEHNLDINKEIIHAHRGARRIEVITSSARTQEGNRVTFVLKGETQHWVVANGGHDLQAVLDRNAAKSPDGASRSLAITNAYEPGEDSVGERDREAYESMVSGASAHSRMLYDSIEAPPEAPLVVRLTDEERAAFDEIAEPLERERAEKEARVKKTRRVVAAVIEAIRGDSTWLDPERITNSILDPRNPPSQSRRFWYNQIVATEDAFVSPQEWGSVIVGGKDTDPETLDPAVRELQTGDRVCVGFDGSFSDDLTALTACRLSDGLVQCLHVWDPADFGGELDRQVVQDYIDFTHTVFDVIAFFGDYTPLEGVVDHVRDTWGPKLRVKASPQHPAAFDMRYRTKDFTVGAERFAREVRLGEILVANPLDPDKARFQKILGQHMANARRRPNRYGVGIGKEHRMSARKIDAAVTAIIARIARESAIAAGVPVRSTPPGVLRRIR